MPLSKITIIGNSVALRVRPPEKQPANLNYSSLLDGRSNENDLPKGIVVNNKALGALTVYNVVTRIDDFIQTFPDIYIINLGVVDASTREVPLWFYRLASSNKDGFVYRLSKLVYRNLIIKIRPFLVTIRGKRSWIRKSKFKRHYALLLKSLLRETNANIITMPINLANDRVEKQLPGSRKKHQQYNQIIKLLAEQYNQYHIDLTDLESEKHYPDGVHFNTEGHRIIAERLYEKVREIFNRR